MISKTPKKGSLSFGRRKRASFYGAYFVVAVSVCKEPATSWALARIKKPPCSKLPVKGIGKRQANPHQEVNGTLLARTNNTVNPITPEATRNTVDGVCFF